MMREKIAIMMDTGCDLDPAFVKKNNIYVLPFTIAYDGEERLDGVMDPLEIYRRFPQEIPKTSTPSPQAVEDMVQRIIADGCESIIAIDISPKLSSTISTVSLILADHPEIPSFVLDTKNISIGSGMLVLWALQKVNEGMTFQELKRYLPEKIVDSSVFFYMDTLDYLKAGGRIGKVSSVVGSLLKIRPIIRCNEEGEYITVAKLRGKKNAKEKLLEYVKEFAGENPVWLGLMNGDAPEEAALMKEILQKEMPKCKIVDEHQITASLAVHTGPGLIGIGVLRNP